MWVLLAGSVRRWVIASIAIPIAANLLTVLAGRLDRRHGPTRLSRSLGEPDHCSSPVAGRTVRRPPALFQPVNNS